MYWRATMFKMSSRNSGFESSLVGHGQETQRQKLGSFCPAECGTFVQQTVFTTRFDEALSGSLWSRCNNQLGLAISLQTECSMAKKTTGVRHLEYFVRSTSIHAEIAMPPLWPNQVPWPSQSGPDKHGMPAASPISFDMTDHQVPVLSKRHAFQRPVTCTCNVLKHSPESPLNLCHTGPMVTTQI